MSGGGEAAHVEADLGEDDLRGELSNAWDGDEQADCIAERAEVAFHLGVDGGDGRGQRVDLAQVRQGGSGDAVLAARSARRGSPRGSP